MAKKVTEEMMRLVQSQLGSAGGKARAAKYSAEQLSEWAKKGGRPRNDVKAQAKKRTPSLEKGRRK